ncbi:hypothetical protein QLL95_gp0534 [Cotonvirus japonicus]|uniref:Uncharacterized protein n=1 Tax=Cotonvirus japonicus TaxID=2811091 RepID=A0ABM7NTY3_9VIRU|nr:hypothetical protein QLL95_gp0534 [Cotonvirus japonicus]BCS83589.1 hypothetical protein [Cotonvirus japonicus]
MSNILMHKNWTEINKKYDIFIVIPKNTLIYRGTSVKICDKNNKYTFYSDFNTATWYAFASDFQKGENGKVICMKSNKQLVLLDMDNINTYPFLYHFDNIPKYQENKDVINFAFGYDHKKSIKNQNLKRCSCANIDKSFCDWFIKSIEGKINIDGYAFSGSKFFHNELMIFDTSIHNKLELMPIEYRFCIYYKKNTLKNYYILEIINGFISRSIKDEQIILFNGSHLEIKWNRNNIYKPDNNRLMDKFYFNEKNQFDKNVLNNHSKQIIYPL